MQKYKKIHIQSLMLSFFYMLYSEETKNGRYKGLAVKL